LPLTWRDLRSIDPILTRDPESVVVITVGLAKSFGRRSAYWLDVYHCPTTKSWYVARQWSFKRDAAIVEDHVVSSRCSGIGQIITIFDEIYSKKTKEGWEQPEVVVGIGLVDDEVTMANKINSLITNANAAGMVNLPEATPVQKQKVTKASRLKQLQNKRKAKAPW